MKRLSAFLLVLALAATAQPSFAQGRGHGPKHRAGHETRVDRDRGVVVIDRDRHRRVIVDYYRSGLPPGLAEREALPPGLRKQLRERGTLPPGLQKRLIAVPGPLVRRLPPVPRRSARYFVGDDLIVVDRDRNVILGIVPDVLPRRR